MRKAGFMLLETLLALALGSGVLFGMMQIFQRTHQTSKKMEAILRLNRDACLIFNQFERDVTTALLGPFQETLTTSDKKQEKKIEKVEKEKDTEQKNEFFYASFYSDQVKKKEEYTMKMLQKMSLINTNPFLIYQEPKIRLVRVLYELKEADKKGKRNERPRYILSRSETYDLKNQEVKFDSKKKEEPTIYTEIRTHTLNKNILSFYAYFHFYEVEEDKKNAVDKNEKKNKTVMLPYLVDVEVTLEDGEMGYNQTYNASFPVIASVERPADQEGVKQGAQIPQDQDKQGDQKESPQKGLFGSRSSFSPRRR